MALIQTISQRLISVTMTSSISRVAIWLRRGQKLMLKEGVWHIRCLSIAIPGRVLGCGVSAWDRGAKIGDRFSVASQDEKGS